MKTILITSGPVHENLDDVKIITNKFKGGRIASLAKRIVREGILLGLKNKKENNFKINLPSELYDYIQNINTDDISKEVIDYHTEYIPQYLLEKENKEKSLYKVIYLCSKSSKIPVFNKHSIENDLLEIVYHNGFNDYYEKVKKYSQEVNAVILGAAVCNLIPVSPIKGKFPSHNYKPNDVIPIDFKIAPRVVDMVKKESPHVHLFAFKLLSGVENDELIDAAYDICLESKATAVIANNLTKLDTKYIVTKEKGILQYEESNYHKFILNSIENEFYKTVFNSEEMLQNIQNSKANKIYQELKEKAYKIIDLYSDKFQKTYGDQKYVFGTVAVRDLNSDIKITTLRGKKDLSEFEIFETVQYSKLVLAKRKVTLNAPLLSHIFSTFKNCTSIVHHHEFDEHDEYGNKLPILPYELPGTQKDSLRDLTGCESGFVIQGHGTFLIRYD